MDVVFTCLHHGHMYGQSSGKLLTRCGYNDACGRCDGRARTAEGKSSNPCPCSNSPKSPLSRRDEDMMICLIAAMLCNEER